MKRSVLSKLQLIVHAAVGVLVVSLLVFLGSRENIEISESRVDAAFIQLQGIHLAEIEQADAPLGIIKEYNFVLDAPIAHDTTLAFYVAHHYIDIYLDDDHVYSLRPSGDISMIQTVGSVWVTIPLYREDTGKEVRVVLTPVYESYQGREVQFLVGSSLAIYKAQLRQSLPELALSLISVLVGIFYLCIAGYSFFMRRSSGNFFMLGLLAFALGLWRLTDTMFSPFLIEKKPAFLFYTSLTMLMLFILPLLKSTQEHPNSTRDMVKRLCEIGASVLIAAQLLLQWFDVLDLRETLSLTHGMLVISVLLVTGEMVFEKIKYSGKNKTPSSVDLIWIIAVGALADLIIYYVRKTSTGLLFTLSAILCYVLLEGVRNRRKQIRLLEEKEIQIIQSRVTTMMSQIRSHFVFNILNAISGMCKYDPEKADETVVRFARYLRSNINIMEDDSLITFRTDLRHLEDYIALEQTRFGDKIQFETDISVDQFMLPPLILQPIVENSIKHGLMPKPSGGTVTLRTRADEKHIQIVLEDDGVGFDMQELEKRNSVGLRNIQFRLHHLMHGKLEIRSEIGQGTITTISIPKEEAEICG